MINRLFVRPILKVTTWMKRNPSLAIALVLFIWWLPTPLAALVWLTNQISGALGRLAFGPAKALVDVLLRVSTAFGNWLGRASGRCFWVGLAILPIMPLVGASLMFWCAIQAIKPGITLSIAEREAEPEAISTIPVPIEKEDKSDDPFNTNPFDFGFPT